MNRCEAYYKFADFWYDGGCSIDGEGTWVSDVFECEYTYYHANFEKDGYCWDDVGIKSTNLEW